MNLYAFLKIFLIIFIFSNQDQQRNNEEDDLDVNYINNIFEMTSREYGDYSQRGNYDEETENFDGSTHYSNRVHSLHRNSAFKSTDALESGLQARVGGTSVRTLGRNKNAGKFQNIHIQYLLSYLL